MSGSESEMGYLLAVLLGYGLGSIPFGQILAHFTGLGDLRRIGSGNVGATNVLRTGRKDVAAATLLLDGAKGASAVLIAAHWDPGLGLAAGAAAVIGHIFPVWLRFHGGKGVATTIGVFLAVNWQLGLAVIGTWLVVLVLGRRSSLSALATMALAPAYGWWLGGFTHFLFALLLGLLVIAMHYRNIRRLLAGEEPRVDFSKRTGNGGTGD